MERLHELFEARYGTVPVSITPIAGSASDRSYSRMQDADGNSCRGVVGTDVSENEAFAYMASHFREKGIPVPEIYAISDDGFAYIQEDLGNSGLLDVYVSARKCGVGLAEAEDLLCRTVALLPKIQFEGAAGFDFSRCHPQQEFTLRMPAFDLNYFKYCFLKPCGLEFNEMFLQDDMDRLASDLVDSMEDYSVPTFLYRDFQARNVMVKDGQPYFIDFQSGRKGPVYYDAVSFIWHPRAQYPETLRKKMLDSYFEALSSYVSVDRELFEERFRIFRLFRYLQILGAYGFRGWIEQKANFVVSIPAALQCLEELLSGPFDRYPYLTSVLKEMIALPRFHDHHVEEGRLEVKVCSFSFKKGIPQDPTGNGGGYVFDCRSIHNPGRYELYKKLTGRDEPVIRFLEDDGEIVRFLEHVYAVVVPHVRTYSERGFNSLMVSFGCTGGQHRSVYCAEHLARHIAELFPDVAVRLTHREQHINESFNI